MVLWPEDNQILWYSRPLIYISYDFQIVSKCTDQLDVQVQVSFPSPAGNVDRRGRGWGRKSLGLKKSAHLRRRRDLIRRRHVRVRRTRVVDHLAAGQQPAVGAVDDLRGVVVIVVVVKHEVVDAGVVRVGLRLRRNAVFVFRKLKLFFEPMLLQLLLLLLVLQLLLWRNVTRVTNPAWRKLDGEPVLAQDLVGVDGERLLVRRQADGGPDERVV